MATNVAGEWKGLSTANRSMASFSTCFSPLSPHRFPSFSIAFKRFNSFAFWFRLNDSHTERECRGRDNKGKKNVEWSFPPWFPGCLLAGHCKNRSGNRRRQDTRIRGCVPLTWEPSRLGKLSRLAGHNYFIHISRQRKSTPKYPWEIIKGGDIVLVFQLFLRILRYI